MATATKFKPKTTGTVVDEATIPVTNTEEVTESVENIDSEDSVNVNADIIQKSPVKNVRILPRTNHSCVIGGTRYTLRKGVQQVVPLEVKNILAREDLLLPL